MAVIRKNDLKQMAAEELKNKLGEVEASAREEFAAIKGGKRPKSINYRALKKTKARILTFLSQKGVKL